MEKFGGSFELLVRPKNTYLNLASWQELLSLTEFWQRELAFYKEELVFLRNLVDHYFTGLVTDKKITDVQAMAKKLVTAENQWIELDHQVAHHLTFLEGLMENPFSHDAHEFREEHIRLEENLTNFYKNIRDVKKEIFALTEHVMRTEKSKHLLGN